MVAMTDDVVSGLPPGEPSFAGRDEDLTRLLEFLAPDAAATVAAVSGMAGIGKTELAVQAARTALARGWFPGGAFFVDMFGYDPARRFDAGQALEGFLRAVGVPGEHVPPAVQDRARMWQSRLNSYADRGKPVLVVVDNVSDTDQARPLLPAHPACRAILTSRHTLGMLGARLIDLDVLPTGAAVDVLNSAIHTARTRPTPTSTAASPTPRRSGSTPATRHSRGWTPNSPTWPRPPTPRSPPKTSRRRANCPGRSSTSWSGGAC